MEEVVKMYAMSDGNPYAEPKELDPDNENDFADDEDEVETSSVLTSSDDDEGGTDIDIGDDSSGQSGGKTGIKKPAPKQKIDIGDDSSGQSGGKTGVKKPAPKQKIDVGDDSSGQSGGKTGVKKPAKKSAKKAVKKSVKKAVKKSAKKKIAPKQKSSQEGPGEEGSQEGSCEEKGSQEGREEVTRQQRQLEVLGKQKCPASRWAFLRLDSGLRSHVAWMPASVHGMRLEGVLARGYRGQDLRRVNLGVHLGPHLCDLALRIDEKGVAIGDLHTHEVAQ